MDSVASGTGILIKCGGVHKEEQNEKGRQRQDLVHCSLAPRDLFEVGPKGLEVDAEFLQKEAKKKPQVLMLILLHEGTCRGEGTQRI